MRKEEQNQIDAYLLNQMSEEELASFFQKLKKDSQLKKEVVLQKETIRSLQTYGNQLLREKLEVIHKEETLPKEPKSNTFNWKWLTTSCCFVLLTFLVYYSYQPKSTNLFEQFYKPYELSLQTRNTENQTKLNQIQKLYDQNAFSTLIPILKESIAQEPKNNRLLLALSIAYIENKKFDAALSTLQKIDKDNPFYKDQALWYTALVQFKIGQIQPAKSILSKLAEDVKADYHHEAKKFLEALERR